MRTDLSVLGKVVGSYESWDQVDENCLIFYKTELNELGRRWLAFIPPELGSIDLSINFTEGTVVAYDEDSNEFSLQPCWATFDGAD